MGIYDFKVRDTQHNEVSLSDYRGKVLLVVNTASGCGFTPQYDGLEALYAKYRAEGFEILDFPCNQFLNQAPGTDEELANFCKVKFGTEFKTFAKVDVNGKDADPLYTFLKENAPAENNDEKVGALRRKLAELTHTVTGNNILWNFTKFLIDREGRIVGRFAPTVTPEELDPRIEALLKSPA